MESRIVLGTGSNQSYLRRIAPYLMSIQAQSSLGKHILFCVDCQPTKQYRESISRFEVVHVPRDSLQAMHSNDCIQHGDFLSFLDEPDDPVIIFTDGDIVMQRDFSPEERRALAELPKAAVMVGPNAGPDDTLLPEMRRMVQSGFTRLARIQQIPLPQARSLYLSENGRREILHKWIALAGNAPCYNTGVIITHASTYREIFDTYVSLWPELFKMQLHHAMQQWLLCAILYLNKHLVLPLPYSIHTHGHYRLPKGASLTDDGVLCYESSSVVFRHHVNDKPRLHSTS